MAEPVVVVLDLDNTLIHASEKPDDRFERFDVETEARTYMIHLRPYVCEFLRHLQSRPDRVTLVIWTAATSSYAQPVVENLFARAGIEWKTCVHALLTREDTVCVQKGVFLKDLDVVRRRFKTTKVLLIDDNPIHTHLPHNRDCVFLIPPFATHAEDAAQDTALHIITKAFSILWKEDAN